MSDVDPIEAVDLAAIGAEMERDPCHREPVAWCSYCRIRAALPALVAMSQERDEARAAMSSDGADAVRDNAALRARVRELEALCAYLESVRAVHAPSCSPTPGQGCQCASCLALRAASRGEQP